MAAAAEKVAEAHGFELADGDALDIDDLEEVSGGKIFAACVSPDASAPYCRPNKYSIGSQ